ncbi:MAG: cell division protein ZapA [Clostridia bacterium]|nr:cell division protein ZapA [Clostridia bacterium]MBQ6059654.1 cell division protein ZapA [Clostridia bacterium]
MSEQYEIRILGTAYNVTTSENRDTVEKTARMVDETMRELMNRNPRASVTMAAIYAAIQFADEKRRSDETADNLRAQLRSYLEDMNKLRLELDEARRRRD